MDNIHPGWERKIYQNNFVLPSTKVMELGLRKIATFGEI